MQGMDGYETLEELRTKDRTRSIPVIAVTAHATSNQLDRIDRHDFDGVLVKPLKIGDLAIEMSHHLDYEESTNDSGTGHQSGTMDLTSADFPDTISNSTLEASLNLYDRSVRTRNLDVVGEFAETLEEVAAVNGDSEALMDYSQTLRKAVENMEFVRINTLLETFDGVADSLEDRLD
jgi:CheY-like chemotaxis protein